MSTASLVVLAAGQGTRFGGPKQLVAVRDGGATITDVVIERATAAGIGHTVVVANDEVAGPLADGLRARGRPIEVVCQPGRRGTAEALLAAREVTDGPVVVVNADDVYPQAAFELAVAHLAHEESAHAVVGFPVGRTLHGGRPQSRALLTATEDGRLVGVREGTVEIEPQLRFLPRGVDGPLAAEPLRGDELVSMNLWVLQRDVFEQIGEALADGSDGEVYLPEVVGQMITAGGVVRLMSCDAACRGITYPEDVATLGPLL